MRNLFSIGEDELGRGQVQIKWSPRGQHLAVAGSKRRVLVYNRNGELYSEIILPDQEMYHSSGGAARGTNPCTNLMVWDPTGARLLVLPRGNTFAIIWTASVREDQRIESSMKQQELTTAAWDKTGSQLAIGTSKGNLLMYSLQTRKITPFMGRHTRRITSIAWNVNNMVATTAEDQDLVVTDAISHREVLKTTLKQDPLDLQFSDRKEDGLQRTKQQNTLSLCHGHTSIYVHQLGTEEMPVELAFEASYGNIQTYFWYGDGYLLIGFVSGHVVVASSHMREMMEEVHSGNYLPGTLSHCAYSPGASQIAIVGKNNLRIMEVGSSYREVKSSAVDLAPGTVLDQVDWTADGQVLSVASRQGQVFSFLAMLPLVNASVGSCVAYLSSLSELSLVQLPNITAPSLPLPLPVEPAFIALCNTHVAVGINNKVWFYEYNLAQASTQLVLQRDYIGTVEGLAMSGSWAAVLTEGRATLHTLFPAQGHSAHDDDVRIPGPGEPSEVTCCKVNDRFLIIGTSKGVLRYYMLEGQAMVNDYKHREAGIQSIFPQPSGTLLIFEDTSRAVFLYNPVSDRLLPLPKFEATLDTVLWDSSHSNCFLVQGGEQWHCYAYHPASTKGAFISLVGSQPAVPQGHPCSLQYGQVFTQLANSTLSETVLDTHEHLRDPLPAKPGNELLQKRFDQAIHLGQLHAAWETALLLKRDKSYKQLAEAAMHHLDVELARSCWQLLGEASMVLSLDALRYVEDKNLLCGHILVLLGSDYHAAQGFFLRSSHPEAALEMWKDLKQWEEALKLVDQLSPDKRASLCQHYAQALELRGSFQEAHQYYKEAMSAEPPLDADAAQKLQDSCSAGLCRTTLHLGEIHRGRQMVLESRNSQLVLECAAILQHMNLLQDAAELYEKCERFEKAAQIYIQTKAFASAAPLMSKISSPKLHIQFAKARESEGHYREAASAYEAAQEIESLTRVLLNHLREPQRAYALVRASGSRAAAALAAQHAEASQDWRSAIEFYLRAGQPQVAYSYAELHREMDVYAEHLDEATTPEEEYVRIAQYYANTAEPEKSAAMYEKCGMMHAAARMLLQNKTDRTVQKAIELVHRTNDKELAQLVMEHVDIQAHGDTHTFQLQMALGQYQAAASTAVSVARFEQGSGHYRLAHGKLFDAAQQLLQVMPELPQELRHALMLLHSYILVRSLLKLGNHSTAARLLVRVARNISKFPTHTVPILTSCVIECHRAGLMETALHYATMLMRPEHRSQIRAPYKKKLETMVRKREKGQDAPEAMMPCPTCGVPGPEMELECSNCQSIIPFCIATGTRMVVDEWAACPQCRFPCRQGPFQELVASDGVCPMCSQPVHPEAVTRSMHPTSRAKDHAFSPA